MTIYLMALDPVNWGRDQKVLHYGKRLVLKALSSTRNTYVDQHSEVQFGKAVEETAPLQARVKRPCQQEASRVSKVFVRIDDDDDDVEKRTITYSAL